MLRNFPPSWQYHLRHISFHSGFAYLRGGKEGTQTSFLSHPLVHSPKCPQQTELDGHKASSHEGKSPVWMAGGQLPQASLPRGCVSRKPEWGDEHSCSGTGHRCVSY